jgi:hypothetical protein
MVLFRGVTLRRDEPKPFGQEKNIGWKIVVPEDGGGGFETSPRNKCIGGKGLLPRVLIYSSIRRIVRSSILAFRRNRARARAYREKDPTSAFLGRNEVAAHPSCRDIYFQR